MIGENRGGRVWPIRMRNVGFFFFWVRVLINDVPSYNSYLA